MPLDLPRATPEQLAEAPELAALEILDCAAHVAYRALLATSPELLDHDFLLEHANITPQLCLGAAVLSALDTLTVAVERYRVHLDQLALLRLRKTENNAF
jgi:hypothetical protein